MLFTIVEHAIYCIDKYDTHKIVKCLYVYKVRCDFDIDKCSLHKKINYKYFSLA